MGEDKSLPDRIREAKNTNHIDVITLNGWAHEIESDYVARDRIGIGDRAHSAWLGQAGTEADREAIEKYFLPRPSFDNLTSVSIGDVAYFDDYACSMQIDSMEFTSDSVTLGASDYEHFLMVDDGSTVPHEESAVDVDGDVIHVGDTVYPLNGNEKFTVANIHTHDFESRDWVESEDGDWGYADRVRLKEIDTQEKIYSDLVLSPCDYFRVSGSCAKRECCYSSCKVLMLKDLLNRQQKIDSRNGSGNVKCGVKSITFTQVDDAE